MTTVMSSQPPSRHREELTKKVVSEQRTEGGEGASQWVLRGEQSRRREQTVQRPGGRGEAAKPEACSSYAVGVDVIAESGPG